MTRKGYPLASSTWGKEETEAAVSCIQNGRTTMGSQVREFENQFSAKNGAKYSVMVNSGSSANLIMLAALRYFEILNRNAKTNFTGEIIVPTVSWSTTFYPVMQLGFRLRFVDIEIQSLNINLEQVESAINEHTRAIFAVNLLGNPASLLQLKEIADRHGLYLLEDNCEALGASINSKKTGTFGLMGSFSTFFSHHISTMEGGVVTTDSEDIYHILLSLRAHGWVRELPENNKIYQFKGDEWLDKFTFVLPGYNFRPLEISGAIGIQQLKKIDEFIATRRLNALNFADKMHKFSDCIQIQEENGQSSYFGFSIILTGELSSQRKEFTQHLNSYGIESRPIVAGNFLKNPVVKFLDIANKDSESFYAANEVQKSGLFIGNHHFNLEEEIDLLDKCIGSFL